MSAIDGLGLASKHLALPNKGYLFVFGAAGLGATSGVMIRYILTHQSIALMPLAFGREFLTFLFLVAGLGLVKRDLLRVERRDLPSLVFMGMVGVGIFHILWAFAISQISIAIATVLNYTAPSFVVIFSWLLWREGITRTKIATLVLTLAGAILLTRSYDLHALSLNGPGLAAGVGTGLTFAIYGVASKQALAKYNPWTVLVYGFGFSALTVFLFQPAGALGLMSSSLPTMGFLLVLVLLGTIGPFALFTMGMKYLRPTVTTITMMIELPMAALLAFLLFGETLGFVELAGAALIVWGVLNLSLARGSTEQNNGNLA